MHIFESHKTSWKKFKLTEIFNVSNSHNILKSDIVFGSGKTPYVTASSINNSVMTRVSYDNDLLEDGDSIMIGGKTMVVTYQPEPYFSNDSHNLVIIPYEQKGRGEDCGLFIATTLKKALSPIYSWGDSISKQKIQKDYVSLPITLTEEPNWDLMSTYIHAIKKQIIYNLKIAIEREKKAYLKAIG